MKKFYGIILGLILSSILFLSSNNVYAANITYLVDTPTYSILDYGSYDIQFRVFSGGGVLTKLNVGIFKVLNIVLQLSCRRLLQERQQDSNINCYSEKN